MNDLNQETDASAWADISPEAVRCFSAAKIDYSGEPDPELLSLTDGLCLSKNGNLTYAGALLLCRRPERYLEGTYVKIGLFDGTGSLVKEDIVRGPLILQPKNAMRKLAGGYIGTRVVYKNMFLDTSYEYPVEGISEAVLNACVHRNMFSGSPVEIRISPDKISVCNDGGLPEGWDACSLFSEHRSRPRNPRIAEAFHEAGMMTCWGKGIGTILDSCAGSSVSAEFLPSRSSMRVVFRPAVPDSVPEEIQTGEPAAVPDLEDRIIGIIAEGSLRTGPEISGALGINRRQFTRVMSKLMSDGTVIREGNRRKGRWIVAGRERSPGSLSLRNRFQKRTEIRLRRDEIGLAAVRCEPLLRLPVHDGDLHMLVHIQAGVLLSVFFLQKFVQIIRGSGRRQRDPVDLPAFDRDHKMKDRAPHPRRDLFVNGCLLRFGADPELSRGRFRNGVYSEFCQTEGDVFRSGDPAAPEHRRE